MSSNTSEQCPKILAGQIPYFSYAQGGLQAATILPPHACDSTLFSTPKLPADTLSMSTIYALSMQRKFSTFLKASVLLWTSKDSLVQFPGLWCLGKKIICLGRWKRQDIHVCSTSSHNHCFLRKLLNRHCENMAFMSYFMTPNLP